MRYLSVLLLFVFPSFVSGQSLTPRALDALSVETLTRAVDSSALVRSLIATLEASNVIVHIQSSRQLPSGIGGTTRFVISRGGYRYVRITIHTDLSRAARVSTLGHELQHACEIAQSNADDLPAVRRLFEHEGDREGDYFETRAAISAERTVRMELNGHMVRRSLQAEPIVKFDH